MLEKIEQPCWYLLVQIQQQKHKDKKWNIFKVNIHWNNIIDFVISLPQGCCSGVFIDNFEYILYLVLVFVLLTLNRQIPANTYGKIHMAERFN